MSISTPVSVAREVWTSIASAAGEYLVTGDRNFFFAVTESGAPAADVIGHYLKRYENEPIVLVTGETLYVRCLDGSMSVTITAAE